MNLYSTSSRLLLRSAPDSSTAKKSSFKARVECVCYLCSFHQVNKLTIFLFNHQQALPILELISSWPVFWGHPFMTSRRKSGFDPLPLSTCVHMSRTPTLWTSTCVRHEMHIALLKRLVQWPTGHKAEIQLYDSNLFKTILFVIYITNSYREKFHFIFRPKTKFW